MRLGLLLLVLSVWVLAQALVPLDTPNFSLSRPSDWEMKRANFADAVLLYPGANIADPALENLQIATSKLSENFSFDSFTFMCKHQIESDYPQVKLVRSLAGNLGKLRGHRFEYAGQHDGRALQMVQVMAMNGDLGYSLLFTANPANYKRFSNQAEAVIRSFKPK